MASRSTASADAAGASADAAGASADAAGASADATAGLPSAVTLAGRVRFGSRIAGLLLALLCLVPLHYLWRLLRLGSPWPRIFLGTAARICGARVRTVGTPLKRDVFYIANHVSWIDILAMGGASGTAFVSKAEIGEAPVVGWLARMNRTVFVKREEKLGVAEQVAALRAALADNWAVTIFPEGTTSDGHSLLPFKTSMLKVLEPPPAGVMVQTVHIDYGAAAEDIAWIGLEAGKDNAVRVLSRAGSFPLVIRYLPPFSPTDFPGRKAIAAESRRLMEEALMHAPGKD